MTLATAHLLYIVDIRFYRERLVYFVTKSKLAFHVESAHQETVALIDETCVEASTRDL